MAADEDDTANATADNRKEVKTAAERYHKLCLSIADDFTEMNR